MYIYTLGFIKRDSEILMLNRNFSPWKGSWNGIGGKRLAGESPLDCIIRECMEETSIKINKDQIKDKGIVTWNNFSEKDSGLHVFLIEVPSDFEYVTPRLTDEGILDWKQMDWISDFDNTGLSSNIPYFIEDVIYDNKKYEHKCLFEGNRLISVERVDFDE